MNEQVIATIVVGVLVVVLGKVRIVASLRRGYGALRQQYVRVSAALKCHIRQTWRCGSTTPRHILSRRHNYLGSWGQGTSIPISWYECACGMSVSEVEFNASDHPSFSPTYTEEMRKVFHHSTNTIYMIGNPKPTTCGWVGYHYGTDSWGVLKAGAAEEDAGKPSRERKVCRLCLQHAPA